MESGTPFHELIKRTYSQLLALERAVQRARAKRGLDLLVTMQAAVGAGMTGQSSVSEQLGKDLLKIASDNG